MNHKLMTYEEWVESMIPLVEYAGRKWHNYGTNLERMQQYVEDWIIGERLWLDFSQSVTIRIGVDLRYIPYGNRNYSDQMWPEYLAIGADKWELPTTKSLGWTNPPPSL